VTWEHASQAVAVAGLVGAVVLSRADGSGTLTIGPTAQPVASEPGMPSVDPSDFAPVPLDPLIADTEVPETGPRLPEAPDITLVVADENELHAISLATGDVRRSPLLAGNSPGLDPWMMFSVGDSLIVNAREDVVRLIGPDLRRVRLARNHHALPTVDGNTVWVLSNQDSDGSSTMVRVRLDGTVVDQVTLPAVAQPTVGVGASMLVSRPSGIHAVSSDDVRRLTASGQLVAAGADRLAWSDCAPDLVCQIVIGTFDDPDQVRRPLAPDELPGGYFGHSFGRFSPDGRLLALPMFRPNSQRGLTQTGYAIIDTTTGAELSRLATRRPRELGNAALDWSPDSRLLFVALGGVSVWNANTAESRELDVGVLRVNGLAVIGQN
jgi:hypothetical protein